ncbi:penicillin-binding protein, partial [Streptococcus pyogenes]
YTDGTAFQVENAYALNGLDISNAETPTPQVPVGQVEDKVDYWTGKAQELIDQTKKNISDADLPNKAKSLWDSITSWFD